MRVEKRNGRFENVSFDKTLTDWNLYHTAMEFSQNLQVDCTRISQKVIQEIYDGVKTVILDELSSQIAISHYSIHPDYNLLASRIVVSNHHKNTFDKFSDKINLLYTETNGSLIAEYMYNLVMENSEKIDSHIDYSRDYFFDYFGLKTLEKSYLFKLNDKIIERPQDMIMRVCLSIHRTDLEKAFESYDHMSMHYFTHATPTLFNAGTKIEQFASCFLLSEKEDSINGIYDTLKDCALISQKFRWNWTTHS